MNGSAKLVARLPGQALSLAAAFALTITFSPSLTLAQTPADQTSLQGTTTDAAASLAPPISLIPSNSPSSLPNGQSQAEILPEGVIAIRELGDVSSDSLGLTDAFTGGLPVSMWQGTSKELVDLLMPSLPTSVTSQAVRDLTKRLLLSVARPPEDSVTEDVFVDMSAIVPSSIGFVQNDSTVNDVGLEAGLLNQEPDLGILERRISQLAAMGDWLNVRALVELVPSTSQTESILKIRTDLALVEGGVDSACAEAGERLFVSEETYWQKVFAFCQLRDGNVAAAFLTIDLLREQGIDDPAFFWAAELMSGNRPITPNGLRRLTPLQLAMLRGAGRPFPTQLVRLGDPTLLRVLAEAEPLFIAEPDEDELVIFKRMRDALDLRLEASERAVALGALDPEVLRNHYRSEIFEEDLIEEEVSEFSELTAQPVAPVDNVEQTTFSPTVENTDEPDLDLDDFPVNTVLARARLFKLAEAQSIPTARAEVISRAIDYARADRGRNGPDVGAMGLIYAPLLKDLVPTGDLVWFAGNAARALVAAGELEAGNEWLELTKTYARTSIEAADVSAAIWPVERQLQPSVTNRFTPLRFKRWEATRPQSRLQSDKTLVLTTLTALGETVTNADWMSLMERDVRQSASFPSPHIWNGLNNAAANQRVGETVLMALIALGNDGPAGASPIVLSHVISALTRIGLEDEARRFAVEAAITYGL